MNVYYTTTDKQTAYLNGSLLAYCPVFNMCFR